MRAIRRSKPVAGVWLLCALLVASMAEGAAHGASAAGSSEGRPARRAATLRSGERDSIDLTKSIVFVAWKKTDIAREYIYKARSDGSHLKRLTSTGRDLDPHWSPDHRKIAFLRERGTVRELWTMRRDGSRERKVAEGDVQDFDWFPNSRSLVFVRRSRRGNRTLHIVRPHEDREDQIDVGNLQPGAPDVSPDGRTIAFVTRVETTDGPTGDLYTIAIDGSELTNLTHNPEGVLTGDPDWSPDGETIAFTTSIDDPRGDDDIYTSQIYTIRPDGSDPLRLTRHETTLKGNPKWNAQGTLVAYTMACDSDYCFGWNEVAVAPADGSGERLLTNTRRRFEGSIVWAPDGSRVAFTSFRISSVNSHLFTMSLEDTRPTKILEWTNLGIAWPDW